MKVGISVGVDVTKIDKARLVQGKYLNLTTFVDLQNKDKYDNNGFVKQSGEKGEDLPILGNSRVFWQGQSQKRQAPEPVVEDFADDIPF